MESLCFSIFITANLGILDSLVAIVASTILRLNKKTPFRAMLACVSVCVLSLLCAVYVPSSGALAFSLFVAPVWMVELFVLPIYIPIRLYRKSDRYTLRLAKKEMQKAEKLHAEAEAIQTRHAETEALRWKRQEMLDQMEHERMLEEEKHKIRLEKLKQEREEEIERFRKEISQSTLSGRSCPDFSAMSGYAFEEYCAKLLRSKGYREVDVTPKSGDFGADIIAISTDGEKTCFQCKNYQTPVGVKAVQEIIAAKAYYHCDVAAVITNSSYNEAAKELARETGVVLMDVGRAKQRIIPLE